MTFYTGVRPKWRDYMAVEKMADGSERALGPVHAKVGDGFRVAMDAWPEVFREGRGRIVNDERAGLAERFGGARA